MSMSMCICLCVHVYGYMAQVHVHSNEMKAHNFRDSLFLTGPFQFPALVERFANSASAPHQSERERQRKAEPAEPQQGERQEPERWQRRPQRKDKRKRERYGQHTSKCNQKGAYTWSSPPSRQERKRQRRADWKTQSKQRKREGLQRAALVTKFLAFAKGMTEAELCILLQCAKGKPGVFFYYPEQLLAAHCCHTKCHGPSNSSFDFTPNTFG